ncbi:M20 family metallopeptidase [Streptomyces sp. NPDC058320]|uniref:M20 family metallopeptidase n=1 Tax=unclassified Streptomyces TaxID=2593676 RepID=UPI00362736D0
MIPNSLVEKAEEYVDSGVYFTDLSAMVAYPTESSRPEGHVAIKAYLDEVLVPALTELGCSVTEYANPDSSGGPFLVGTRVESPELPTVLCYGHADVVDGQAGRWSEGRDPWTLTAEGDRWYGRGSADNKGQHLANIAALRLLLAEQGSLGFNLTFLFETGEEIGSPGLAEFAAAHRAELRADVLIASDGPRLDATTPTLFLGSRGGVGIMLDVDLRPDAYHSGNWGGVIRNPATTLAGAIASLVDGHGRIQVPALLPSELPAPVREALTDVVVAGSPGDPAPDKGWGDTTLTAAERLYGWNTLEVLSLGAADIDRPVNAIPGRARAVLQLRYVAGTDVSRAREIVAEHLSDHGYPMVDVTVLGSFAASRTALDDPWLRWAKGALEQVTDKPVAVLPNIGGSLPNHVFTDILGLPTLWLPHSYPGCLQHAPDEHMLSSIAREGVVLAATLFHALGHPSADRPLPARAGLDQPVPADHSA